MSSTRRLPAAKHLVGSGYDHISYTRSRMRSSLALVVISATAQASVSVITACPDDSEPVQHAIDTVHDRFRECIVFVPQGRYRLTRTIYLWPGVRLIDYARRGPCLYSRPIR